MKMKIDSNNSNRKKKWSFGRKVVCIAAVAIVLVVLLRFVILGGAIGFLVFDGKMAKVEVHTDISDYQKYIGKNAEDTYRNKWGMDERIFPSAITSDMNVLDYKMVYYNPWDAQYLSYLVVEYEEEAYEQERERLKDCLVEDYEGYFGAQGFEDTYELLAMNADSNQGFVYALASEEHQIIYVEVIFCNYFLDLSYEDYIDRNYLPIGFDASIIINHKTSQYIITKID